MLDEMTNKNNGETNISTYHEYINEGIFSLRTALSFLTQAKNHDKESSSYYDCLTEAGISSRYAFLMIANSLESAANAFLLDLYLPDDSYKELEKLGTLSKITMYCDLKGFEFDNGKDLTAKVKEIISCRNEFVHPKPKSVEVDLSGDEAVLLTKTTKSKKYPLYFSEIKFEHTIEALKDTLDFLAWVCFDVCKYEREEGSFIIGFNSIGSTADIDIIAAETNYKFDLRTFNRT